MLAATVKKIQDHNKKQFKMDASVSGLRDISKFSPDVEVPAGTVVANEDLGKIFTPDSVI